jgi:hypothetical protein
VKQFISFSVPEESLMSSFKPLITNHRKIVSQIHKSKTAYSSEKWSENVLKTKFDSKRCDIFTRTKKLGGLTAVFLVSHSKMK